MRRILPPSASIRSNPPYTTSADSCRAAACLTYRKARSFSRSSLLSHMTHSPQARSNPALIACDMDEPGCGIHRACGWAATSRALSSSDPPSTTKCSSNAPSCLATLARQSPRKRPPLRFGVMMVKSIITLEAQARGNRVRLHLIIRRPLFCGHQFMGDQTTCGLRCPRKWLAGIDNPQSRMVVGSTK